MDFFYVGVAILFFALSYGLIALSDRLSTP
jgi:hypothetical protein